MQYKHPAHFFIKYLLSLGTPECQEESWVFAALAQHMLDEPDKTYFRELKVEVNSDMPSDYRPRDRSHGPSVEFQKSHKIYAMHHPDSSVKLMQERILFDPWMRDKIEKLLLGRFNPQYISSRLNQRFRTVLTERMVSIYKHFFYNTDILTPEEWAVVFGGSTNAAEGKNRMSILRVGPALALHRTGIRQVIESKQAIKHAQQMIYMRLLEVNQMPCSESAVRMHNSLTRTLLATDERLSQSDVALKEVLDEFRKFSMERRSEGPVSIQDLAPDGQFSGSGKKLGDGKGKGSA